ncbi:MAG: ribosome maturation factor RimP [Wenzhouxiangellaceae bacterium]
MVLEDRLNDLLHPLVTGMGYEFVGLELSGPRHALLRVYIDRGDDQSVTLDDCERVSREVAALLDVEDPINSSYRLEISSPGIDRPLFEPAHYAQFQGERIKLALHVPVNGRRRLQGVIEQVTDEAVMLRLDEGSAEIPFASIARARIMPDYDALLKAGSEGATQ